MRVCVGAERWITELNAVGGSCHLVGEHIHTTCSFVCTTPDEQLEAARLVALLAKDPGLLKAVKGAAHIESSVISFGLGLRSVARWGSFCGRLLPR